MSSQYPKGHERGKMKNNKKLNLTAIIITFLIVVGCVGIVGFISNGTYEFQIDDNTQKAINDLSSFSEYNNTLIINNNNYEAPLSCIKGCEAMHYNLVGYDGVLNGQQGYNNKFWYKSDCINICDNLK